MMGSNPDDDFDTVLRIDPHDPDLTLLIAISANIKHPGKRGHRGNDRLSRHGAAALLNAAHPDINYPYSVEEVIAFVQAGDDDPLVSANEDRPCFGEGGDPLMAADPVGGEEATGDSKLLFGRVTDNGLADSVTPLTCGAGMLPGLLVAGLGLVGMRRR